MADERVLCALRAVWLRRRVAVAFLPDALRAFCVRLRVCDRLADDWLRLCVFERLVVRVPLLLRAVEPPERLLAVLRRLVERVLVFWL